MIQILMWVSKEFEKEVNSSLSNADKSEGSELNVKIKVNLKQNLVLDVQQETFMAGIG